MIWCWNWNHRRPELDIKFMFLSSLVNRIALQRFFSCCPISLYSISMLRPPPSSLSEMMADPRKKEETGSHNLNFISIIKNQQKKKRAMKANGRAKKIWLLAVIHRFDDSAPSFALTTQIVFQFLAWSITLDSSGMQGRRVVITRVLVECDWAWAESVISRLNCVNWKYRV